MHNAPSVSFPVGRSLLAGLLAATAWALGVVVVFSWTLQAPVSGWRSALAGAALVLAGAAAAWNWWRMPGGTLAWDGRKWAWTTAGGTVSPEVEVCLDLQGCLLLRLTDPPGRCWLWLERSHCAERWDDLRRAVYSRARSQSPTDAAGAAEP